MLPDVISTSGRLLRLVSLLSTRPSWTNGELAERMEVTERTVRRDIAKLRDLGYGIESDPGPWGGYRLSGGAKVPPLSLDDEEAFAVAVALREAALNGVLGSDQAALSALLKLQRLLPSRIADRLGELDAAFVHTPRSGERQFPPACCWSWPPPAAGANGPGCPTATGWTGPPSATSTPTASCAPVTSGTWSPWTSREASGGRSGPTGSRRRTRPVTWCALSILPTPRCSSPACSPATTLSTRPSAYPCPWTRRCDSSP
jgi:biotin operon repressor